jgi:uncharacterized protein (TIGR02466 family)
MLKVKVITGCIILIKENDMNKPNFTLIFPTPVMSNNIDRDFVKEELAYIKSQSTCINRNQSNVTSSNTYILNEPEMANLKKFVTDQLNEYVKQVYKPKYKSEAFVTQSWLNWTKKGEFHHKHNHPNSFISGVLYISTDLTKDKITFHRAGYRQLQLASDTFDIYNSDSWWFNVKTGDIVMFPSSLTHHVEDVIADDVRVSLAFNSLIKGALGDNKSLTAFINE